LSNTYLFDKVALNDFKIHKMSSHNYANKSIGNVITTHGFLLGTNKTNILYETGLVSLFKPIFMLFSALRSNHGDSLQNWDQTISVTNLPEM